MKTTGKVIRARETKAPRSREAKAMEIRVVRGREARAKGTKVKGTKVKATMEARGTVKAARTDARKHCGRPMKPRR